MTIYVSQTQLIVSRVINLFENVDFHQLDIPVVIVVKISLKS